ncbi:MAG: riboflavin synthase [Chitinivibrionales bacterium]
MFTGLIETTGVIQEIRRLDKSMALGVLPGMPDFDVSIGASVSINGVCLTLESVAGKRLFFTAVHETLDRTTFKNARVGDVVNLERALRASDRLDGHMVLGHVDCLGSIDSDRKEGAGIMRSITVSKEVMALMAEKGSVAVDGISLTIANIHNNLIVISLIPRTLETTTMGRKTTGDAVNIECDIVARYVARMLRFPLETTEETGLSGTLRHESLIDKLERSGF